MLTDEEKHEIDAELAHYPTKQAACVEAMKIVQTHRGWVSEENMRDVAAYLSMSATELDSVATFYNLVFRQPVGRHVILICNSISCWVMGYQNVFQGLSDRLGIGLGQTTPDNRFTLLPLVCLGTCDHAPALMIDQDLYRDLAPSNLDEILARYQ